MNRLKQWARLIKRDVHALYFAARDPRVPWYAKALALVVAGYALSPIDLIPDFIPVLGLVDDALLIPAGVWLFLKMVPREVFEEHRATAEAAARRPKSGAGVLIVLAIWAAAAMLVWRLWSWNYA